MRCKGLQQYAFRAPVGRMMDHRERRAIPGTLRMYHDLDRLRCGYLARTHF